MPTLASLVSEGLPAYSALALSAAAVSTVISQRRRKNIPCSCYRSNELLSFGVTVISHCHLLPRMIWPRTRRAVMRRQPVLQGPFGNHATIPPGNYQSRKGLLRPFQAMHHENTSVRSLNSVLGHLNPSLSRLRCMLGSPTPPLPRPVD